MRKQHAHGIPIFIMKYEVEIDDKDIETLVGVQDERETIQERNALYHRVGGIYGHDKN